MEWTDDAIVLSSRPHGENSTVVMLLTETQGLHAGLVAGGQGTRAQALYQPGNHIKVRWRARIVEQLGYFQADLLKAFPSFWLDEPRILAMIASACAMTEAALPERQPMPGVYMALYAIFQMNDPELWAPLYVKWELGLLQALGYGLDFSKCASGGDDADLAYVSPRTGRAVAREAGRPYHEKLFPLPRFLIGGPRQLGDIHDGLALAAHFFTRHIFANPQNRRLIANHGDLPLARQRLRDLYPATEGEDQSPDEHVAAG